MKRTLTITLALVCLVALSATSPLLAKNNNSPNSVSVDTASVNFSTNQMMITGANFTSKGAPTVTLGATTLGVVGSPTATQITVNLPNGIAAGTYIVTVASGNESDTLDVAIGAVGPMGPQGPQGSAGATGPAGSQGPA